MWNEVTFLWNELTIFWNDLTTDWNDLTWNDLTMERNDRIPLYRPLYRPMSRSTLPTVHKIPVIYCLNTTIRLTIFSLGAPEGCLTHFDEIVTDFYKYGICSF